MRRPTSARRGSGMMIFAWGTLRLAHSKRFSADGAAHHSRDTFGNELKYLDIRSLHCFCEVAHRAMLALSRSVSVLDSSGESRATGSAKPLSGELLIWSILIVTGD
jgi:hypothetical protein